MLGFVVQRNRLSMRSVAVAGSVIHVRAAPESSLVSATASANVGSLLSTASSVSGLDCVFILWRCLPGGMCLSVGHGLRGERGVPQGGGAAWELLQLAWVGDLWLVRLLA